MFAPVSVMYLRVDFGRLADEPFEWLTGPIRAQLDHHIPWIRNWLEDINLAAGDDPPPLADLAWKTALALQHRPGNQLGFVTHGQSIARGNGIYDVVYQYRYPNLARKAGMMALGLIHLLAPAEIVKDTVSPHEFAFSETGKDAVWRFQPKFPNISTLRMIKEAERRNIPWRLTDLSATEFGHGCQARQMVSSNPESLSWVGCQMVENKAVTNRELARLAFPVPRQSIATTAGEAITLAQSIGFPVVVKPVDGKAGIAIGVGLNTENLVRFAFLQANRYSEIVVIEKYIEGNDHRMLVIGGVLVAVAKRMPAQVHGDGLKTVRQLVEEENARRTQRKRDARYNLRLDIDALSCLWRQNFTPDSVPGKGEVAKLRFVANYSQGGTVEDMTDQVHPDNRALAVRAARVFGLDLTGIDFITPDISRSYRDVGGAICEVGARVGVFLHSAPDKGKKRNVTIPIMARQFPPGSDGRIPIATILGTHQDERLAHALTHILACAGRSVGIAGHASVSVAGDRVQPIAEPIKTVLCDRRVDTAIQAIASSRAIERGLGIETCSVGVVSGYCGKAAFSILATASRNCVVVDWDVNSTRALVKELSSKHLCLVSTNLEDSGVREHMAAGGRTVVWGTSVTFSRQGSVEFEFDAPELQQSLRRHAIMGAAIAWNMGVDINDIRQGVLSLNSDALTSPLKPDAIARLRSTFVAVKALAPERLWSGDELAKATGGRWISGDGSEVAVTGCLHIYPYFNRICEWLRPGDLATTTCPEQWGKKFKAGKNKAGTWPSLSKQVSFFFDNGAAAVMAHAIPKNLPKDKPVLLVDDTFVAFERLAVAARERFKGKVICVTGSVGKTSTRELIRHCLSKQAPTTATEANRNILTGIKGTLAKTPANFGYGVYEVSHPLTVKGRLARPHVGIITEIQPDHLEFIHTLESIAEQKAELFNNLVPGGTAVINRDSPFYYRIRKIAEARDDTHVATFGVHKDSDARLVSVSLKPNGSTAEATIFGDAISYTVPLPGQHMVMNTLAALLAIRAAGGDWRRAAQDLASMEALPNRINRERIAYQDGHIELINDGYSVNPASLKAGLAVAALVEPESNGRRIAVLGEMLELGQTGPRLHAEIAPHILKAGIDRVYSFGPLMRHLQDALPEDRRAYHDDDTFAVADAVIADLRPNDVVFIKGSNRTTHLTARIVNTLKSPGRVSQARPKSAEIAEHKATPLPAVEKRKADRVFTETRSPGQFDMMIMGDITLSADSNNKIKVLATALNHADLSVAMLSGPATDLSDSPLAGKKINLRKGNPKLVAEQLAELNIGLAGLANNHALDYGPEGFEQTLTMLEDNCIGIVGGGRNLKSAAHPYIGQVYINNRVFRFAVFSAFQFRDRHKRIYGSYAEKKKSGVRSLIAKDLAIDIALLKKHDPELFVIVLPHWVGRDRWKESSQTEQVDVLAEAGADLILGTGAGRLQELDKRGDCWVAFGLGEAVRADDDGETEIPYSLLARLIIDAQKDALIPTLRLYPIRQEPTTSGPRFLSEAECAKAFSCLRDAAPDPHMIETKTTLGDDEVGHYLEIILTP